MEKLALDVLFDAISGTNEAPLQKFVLESGLCEKMGVYISSSGFRNNITVEFSNVKDGSADELFKLLWNIDYKESFTLESPVMSENKTDIERLEKTLKYLKSKIKKHT